MRSPPPPSASLRRKRWPLVRRRSPSILLFCRDQGRGEGDLLLLHLLLRESSLRIGGLLGFVGGGGLLLEVGRELVGALGLRKVPVGHGLLRGVQEPFGPTLINPWAN